MEYAIEFEKDGQRKLAFRNELHKALALSTIYNFWIISVGRFDDKMFFPLAIIARSSDFSSRFCSPRLQFNVCEV